jgi:hypothetical protein
MNPLVKKEIRLLLPAWIAAMLLAITPVWIFWKLDRDGLRYVPLFPAFIFLLGMLFLAIAPFGQEFSFKTFSHSLAQPVPRKRLWLVKTGMLAAAFLSVLAAGLLSWTVCLCHKGFLADALADNFKIAAIGVMAFLSGGLWTALLFRQVTAAFWFTLLAPIALLFLVGEFSDHYRWSDDCSVNVLAVVLGLYSIAGFFLARRLFFRAQDVQWTGGNILFLRRRKSRGHSGAIIPGGLKNRFVALIWKEIQLHEINLLIGAILFALHVVTLWGRSVVSNGNLIMAFDMYWSLWLLMPLFIGSAAVAEERKLGTLESQLCLPVSRTAQFSFKFFTGLILSLLLGAVVPSLIEHTRTFGTTRFFDYWIFVYAAAVFFISFYASTLARSTLQAIGMAIGIPIVVWAAVFAIVTLFVEHGTRFGGFADARWIGLAVIIATPTMPLILARLMFWNFKWLHRDWKLWGCNAATVLTSIVSICLLAGAIYYRTWELLMPADYPHGPAQLSDSKSVKLSITGGDISVVLPDGRLWVENLEFNPPYFGMWETFAPARCKAQFIGGSNWTEVASGWRESLAIQSNGSLWGAHQRWQQPDFTQSAFTRIGSETNWLQIAGGRGSPFLLLKTDGSLWNWGANSAKTYFQRQTLDFKTPPARAGSETNWTALFATENDVFAKKSDGSIWSWQSVWNGNSVNYPFVQNTNTDISWRGFNDKFTGIGTNGGLWIASGQWDGKSRYVPQTKFQLGKGMQWKAANFIYWEDAIIALRSDGTLWKWSPLWQPDFDPSKIHATQLGNHSDWIALPDSWMGIALAADGGLWSWGMPDCIWLAPSRKPVHLGNVFGKSD